MPKERTDLSKYRSPSSGEPCRAAQYIAEIICQRIANKEKVGTLAYKFWNQPKWKKIYIRQVSLANKLIKDYGDDFVRFIKGSTGFIEAKDISEIWKRVTTMLQDSVTEGKITQDEANTILKRIKNAYANVDSKTGEVTTSNMNGLLMLRSDLDEIAKESGYTELTEKLPTNSEVAAELAKGQSDIPSRLGRWFRSVKEYGLGITTKEW